LVRVFTSAATAPPGNGADHRLHEAHVVIVKRLSAMRAASSGRSTTPRLPAHGCRIGTSWA
jgi:hypothetical protein